MKSEERHQLRTNDLSVVATNAAGFFERHLGTVISVICVTLIATGVGFWWTRTAESDNAAGWTMLDTATNIEEFGSVADRFKGKPPGQWAQLQIAEKTLQNAMPLMFANRDLALGDLKSAREGFDSLLRDKTVPPTIRERSLWGLALCLETGCDGDTSKAIEAYQHLLIDFPDSMFKSIAEERIAALKKPGATDFYTWFSKESPEPADARPNDVNPNGITLPAPKDKDMDDDEDESPETPAPKPPDGEKPEEGADAAKPADKPAEGAKPAESEKPATEAPKEGDKPNDKN